VQKKGVLGPFLPLLSHFCTFGGYPQKRPFLAFLGVFRKSPKKGLKGGSKGGHKETLIEGRSHKVIKN